VEDGHSRRPLRAVDILHGSAAALPEFRQAAAGLSRGRRRGPDLREFAPILLARMVQIRS
jgi:hypothetical protein